MLISKQGSRCLLLIFIFQLNSFLRALCLFIGAFRTIFIYPQIRYRKVSFYFVKSFTIDFIRCFLLFFFDVQKIIMCVNWILGFVIRKILLRCGTVCEFRSIYLYLIVTSCIINTCLSFSLPSMIIPTSPFPCITIHSKYSATAKTK